MNSDFKELLKIFNDAQVKYLIVGGYAVMKLQDQIDVENLLTSEKVYRKN